MIVTGERTQFQEAIVERYGETAERIGRSQGELLQAFPVGREGYDSEAVLEVNGIKHDSFRHHVGALDPTDLSRGGGEITIEVIPTPVFSEKVFSKSLGMKGKHDVIAAADAIDPKPLEIKEPTNVGGKSGIRSNKEALENMTRRDRDELIAQHVEAHNINPYTNAMATDIRTFEDDMNAAARKLLDKWGPLAGAAASGVSKAYGGEPELQAPRTGLGASIALDCYFQDRANRGDKRVQEALQGGRPLTILLQGLGKAGMHHLLTLPYYLRVRGVKEQGGALVARGGIDSFLELSPEEIAQLSHRTKLGQESRRGLVGAEWLEPGQLREFWAKGAHAIGPCFDRNQFDLEDAVDMSEGTMVGEAVANGPFTVAAQLLMAERGVDLIPEPISNLGGTAGSRGIWGKFIRPEIWTPAGFDDRWQRRVRGASKIALERRSKASAESGRFETIPHATDLVVLETAFGRLDAIR
jgi:glutamate dehydrogenase/leucine dehydrogenase